MSMYTSDTYLVATARLYKKAIVHGFDRCLKFWMRQMGELTHAVATCVNGQWSISMFQQCVIGLRSGQHNTRCDEVLRLKHTHVQRHKTHQAAALKRLKCRRVCRHGSVQTVISLSQVFCKEETSERVADSKQGCFGKAPVCGSRKCEL